MTAKAALCRYLLEGRVLNVANCFRQIGLTNIAREIPRMVEKEFNVEVSRTPKSGKNRYGSPVAYMDYRLNSTPYNAAGIEAMRKYVEVNGGTVSVGRPIQNDAIEPGPSNPSYKPLTLF